MSNNKRLPNTSNGLSILGVFGIALAIIAVLALFLYPPIAKLPQKMTDLYYDFSWTNTNKSGELHLSTFLTVLGIGLIAWLDAKRKPSLPSEMDSETSIGLYFAIVALPLLLHYFIHGSFPLLFLILGIIFIGTSLVCRQLALKAVFTYAFIYFACAGVISLFKNDHITETVVTVVSLFIFAPVFGKASADEKLFDKAMLAAQIFIPLCLCIFLRNEYIADGEIIVIPFPRLYTGIFIAIIIVSIAYAVIRFTGYLWRVKAEKEEGGFSLDKLILISTLCVIAAYRVDINLSRFLPSDYWHYGEKVIAWQQVIELGKVPYKEFFPPSGLFSIVNGFFLNTVFDGTATSIYPALTFLQVFNAFIIITVLSFAVGPALSALLLYILPITAYERWHLIYLSFAILALPVIRKDINKWLKVWGLLVVANLLNYALYGLSLAVAGMPFALSGIYIAFKRGEIFKWLRKPAFYLAWIAVFAAIVPFIPLMLRIITTSAISGAATVQRDGRALLTNNLDIPFYWPNRIVQYTVILTVLSLAVMIPAYILMRLLRSSAISKIEEKVEHPLFYFSTLGLFFLPAAYTFAVVRLDQGALFRPLGPMAIVLVLCVVAIVKYAHPVFAFKERLSLLVIIFSLACPFVWRHNSFRYINKIQVPNNYAQINDEDRNRLPRLGNGFIQKDDLNELYRCYNFIEKNKLWEYDFYFGDFLANYIFDIGAPGSAGQWIAHGYELSKLYYDAFKDMPFAGVRLNHSRYINYWLFIDKDIVQTPEGFWVSPELVKGKYNPEDLIKPEFRADMGLYTVAFGRSMKSLRPIFESVRLVDANIWEPCAIGIKGTDADFIYIEFDTDAKIKNKYFEAWDFNQYGIRFFFKHNGQWDRYDLPYGDGRLLLPLGDDSRWLYENIEEIVVELDKGFSPDSQGKIKKMELLKLKRYR